MNPHQLRRSLAFAHRPQTRDALAWWSGWVYNWVRPHPTLKELLETPEGNRLYQQRTPAMAIGLTDKIWNVVDLLRFPTYPSASRV